MWHKAKEQEDLEREGIWDEGPELVEVDLNAGASGLSSLCVQN